MHINPEIPDWLHLLVRPKEEVRLKAAVLVAYFATHFLSLPFAPQVAAAEVFLRLGPAAKLLWQPTADDAAAERCHFIIVSLL